MLIYGGPMMGMAISREDIPVTKGCSGILALDKLSALEEEGPCIRCGRCVDACPMLLSPTQIDQCMRKDLYEDAEALGRHELHGMRRVLLELPVPAQSDPELPHLQSGSLPQRRQ